MKKSNGNVGNIRRSIYVKLGILGVVLLLVCSALVTSLSHTVDYTNVDYFTDDSETRIHNSNGNYYAATATLGDFNFGTFAV